MRTTTATATNERTKEKERRPRDEVDRQIYTQTSLQYDDYVLLTLLLYQHTVRMYDTTELSFGACARCRRRRRRRRRMSTRGRWCEGTCCMSRNRLLPEPTGRLEINVHSAVTGTNGQPAAMANILSSFSRGQSINQSRSTNSPIRPPHPAVWIRLRGIQLQQLHEKRQRTDQPRLIVKGGHSLGCPLRIRNRLFSDHSSLLGVAKKALQTSALTDRLDKDICGPSVKFSRLLRLG
jgi:hypothetical protein